jgi:hypothetical protein
VVARDIVNAWGQIKGGGWGGESGGRRESPGGYFRPGICRALRGVVEVSPGTQIHGPLKAIKGARSG